MTSWLSRPARELAFRGYRRYPVARSVCPDAHVFVVLPKAVVEQRVLCGTSVEIGTDHGVSDQVAVDAIPSRLSRDTKAEAPLPFDGVGGDGVMRGVRHDDAVERSLDLIALHNVPVGVAEENDPVIARVFD